MGALHNFCDLYLAGNQEKALILYAPSRAVDRKHCPAFALLKGIQSLLTIIGLAESTQVAALGKRGRCIAVCCFLHMCGETDASSHLSMTLTGTCLMLHISFSAPAGRLLMLPAEVQGDGGQLEPEPDADRHGPGAAADHPPAGPLSG